MTTQNCAVCGVSFTDKKHPNRKYCSHACTGIGQRKRIERTCPGCGARYETSTGSEFRKYCSRSCAYAHMSHPSQGKRETRICKGCGTPFEAWASRSTGYCSKACAHESRRRPDNQVERLCEECGKPYTVDRYFVEKRTSRYCSQACKYSAYSQRRRGSGNGNYRGGTVLYRGPNWGRQRRKALKRDGYRCQICHAKVVRKSGKFGVHHIRPFRDFDGDYESANKLDNLITLCASCHSRVEFGNLPCPRPLL